MNIIKLSATASTNDFLKEKLSKQYLENFTVVVTENQTDGRGQMGAKWNAEAGKNLTFSVLIKDVLLEINSIFHLNVAVAVSIVEALREFQVPDLAIKWPNDILAGNKKIGGILIENSIKNQGEIFSVVGIGLNVNQNDFQELPKAGSLFTITNKEFDKEVLMLSILQRLKKNMSVLLGGDFNFFWESYDKLLYKKGVPMPFEDTEGNRFMGIIQRVTDFGKLEILLESDSFQQFDIKEIQMLY
ncbi:biotin--[acetyl-CoA-carboxylase] ligase [Flavobacterium sp. SM15]|uniref:biotin--[acetyl-CoA-carboxylase] ligase n=1 Tax=Flavobacterium sp. SM15 TaxID=2908005 RepID=UPI001EDBE1C7|nr:biotin--[acetyl-CoA-carboxylase] ligase [Flavobacterium sp. SM15]MCG2612418.1 biotin--[acetyl-CoA-carboxylase] ligase [Flavobacterium sp. SM15]